MVGAIGQVLSVGPVRGARASANAPADQPARGADRVEISNLGVGDLVSAPGAGAEDALNQAAAGESGLGEVAGILGEVQKLVGQGGDYSLDDANWRQLIVDANLASVDRVAGTAGFKGSLLLDGNAVVASGGNQVALPSVKTTDLGIVAASGGRYALADLRRGGALAWDSDGARRLVHAAMAEVAGARDELGAFAKKVRGTGPAVESAGQMAEAMKAIREMMLGGGSGAVGEGNRAAVLQMLK